MFNFTEDQISEMRARVRIEERPKNNDPFRKATISDNDRFRSWDAYQNWRMARATNPGVVGAAIVWDRCTVSFPSAHLEPKELAEMALALLVLGEIAEKWNADAGQPIPEQMARIAAEEAVSK